MSKIRMNTEFRTKILNRYVESAENENTQEREAFNQAREKVDQLYPQAFKLCLLKKSLLSYSNDSKVPSFKKRWSSNLMAKLYQLVEGIAQILISSITFFNFFS